MNERIEKPQYFRIALDIADRTAKGELEEGRKLYGRSVMASEYGVSPETMRRAFKLLADVEILEIKPQSGAMILSAKKAQEYVDKFEGTTDIQNLNKRLKMMMAEQAALSKRMAETVADIAEIEKRMMTAAPFCNYEIKVPKNSAVNKKSLSELCFWQSTGATIIAIRRDGEILLSPGPYALLIEDDIIVFIGSSETVMSVRELLEGSDDETEK